MTKHQGQPDKGPKHAVQYELFPPSRATVQPRIEAYIESRSDVVSLFDLDVIEAVVDFLVEDGLLAP